MKAVLSLGVARKLIAYLALIFLATILVITLTLSILLHSFLPRQTLQYFQATVDQIAYQIDAEVKGAEALVRTLAVQPTISYCLEDMQLRRDASYKSTYRIVREVLRVLPKDREHIDNIFVFPISGEPINAYYSHPVEALSERDRAYMDSIQAGELIFEDYRGAGEHLTAYALIQSSSGGRLGMIRVDFFKSALARSLQSVSIGETENIFLGNKQGDVLLSAVDRSDWQLNERDVAASADLSRSGWAVRGTIPIGAIDRMINTYNLIVFLIITAVFAAITALLVFFISRMLRPLQSLTTAMQSVQRGELRAVDYAPTNNEFDMILNNFNDMVGRIKELMNMVSKQSGLVRDAKLAEINAKLDPHFLYNALDTAYWMAIRSKHYQLGEFLISLTDILRYSISDSNQLVRVEDELGVLKKYVALHNARFIQELECAFLVPASVMDVKIIKFLFQPLVENAIKHGFRELESGCVGMIVVSCMEMGEDVQFTVADNGCGMSTERLREVFMLGRAARTSGSIGISMVNERLRYTYGEDYMLVFAESPGGGVSVSFKVKREVPEVIAKALEQVN